MKLPYGTKKAIKQYLKERCSKYKAAHILRKTERIYTSFVREAPAPNIMNFLRCQYYGGLSVFAFYEAMNGKVDENTLQEILWSMLLFGGDIRQKKILHIRFSGTWLQKAVYAALKRYSAFVNSKIDKGEWKNTWRIIADPCHHKNGFSMPMMNCPAFDFAKKHGYEHLMPLFCGSDFKVAEKFGLILIREHTEAEGFEKCDFWYLFSGEKKI